MKPIQSIFDFDNFPNKEELEARAAAKAERDRTISMADPILSVPINARDGEVIDFADLKTREEKLIEEDARAARRKMLGIGISFVAQHSYERDEQVQIQSVQQVDQREVA